MFAQHWSSKKQTQRFDYIFLWRPLTRFGCSNRVFCSCGIFLDAFMRFGDAL